MKKFRYVKTSFCGKDYFGEVIKIKPLKNNIMDLRVRFTSPLSSKYRGLKEIWLFDTSVEKITEQEYFAALRKHGNQIY